MNAQGARPTVVVAVHDGFYGSGTGAGYANHAFLRTLAGLLAPGVHLAVMPIRLVEDSPEHQAAWHRRTLDLCDTVAASVLPVDNGTGGMVRFGGVEAFRRAGASAAAALREQVLPTAGQLAVICFDVPFLSLPPLLPADLRPRVTLVPRSTGLLHDPTGRDRIAFEREGLAYLAAHGGRIAAISDYMREHLLRDYAVPAGALAALADGIAPDEWDPRPTRPHRLPPGAQAGFVFALGRATPYKGWDDLIDALDLLRRRGPVPHAVLAAVTDQPALTDYQRDLADRIDALKLDATLLTRFDAANRELLTHPALRAAVVPSRTEPFGRIPLEAYAAGAAPVVATTAGGLADQVIDGVTGFTAPPADPPALAAALARALALDPAERAEMRAAGHDLARARFDHEQAVRRFFADFAPWAVRPPT